MILLGFSCLYIFKIFFVFLSLRRHQHTNVASKNRVLYQQLEQLDQRL
jgi:hypothetical protein